MSLIVDRIKCFHSSDSADDIYLIVFRGRTTAPFESNLGVVGPGAVWADFKDGHERGTDVKVAATMSDAIYAVMMVDQDDGKDIAGDQIISAWRTHTDFVWSTTMLSLVQAGKDPTSAASGTEGFKAIEAALNNLASAFMGNDDVIDIRRVNINTVTQSQNIEFYSPPNEEDARYYVTFKHV